MTQDHAEKKLAIRGDALRRVEASYRMCLARDPSDMTARVALGWCLLLRALHEAGREAALAGLCSSALAGAADASRSLRTPDPPALELLRDCLRQTTTVAHLSPVEMHSAEVERIRELVEWAGAESALAEADREGARILGDLTRALLSGADAL